MVCHRAFPSIVNSILLYVVSLLIWRSYYCRVVSWCAGFVEQVGIGLGLGPKTAAPTPADLDLYDYPAPGPSDCVDHAHRLAQVRCSLSLSRPLSLARARALSLPLSLSEGPFAPHPGAAARCTPPARAPVAAAIELDKGTDPGTEESL